MAKQVQIWDKVSHINRVPAETIVNEVYINYVDILNVQ